MKKDPKKIDAGVKKIDDKLEQQGLKYAAGMLGNSIASMAKKNPNDTDVVGAFMDVKSRIRDVEQGAALYTAKSQFEKNNKTVLQGWNEDNKLNNPSPSVQKMLKKKGGK